MIRSARSCVHSICRHFTAKQLRHGRADQSLALGPFDGQPQLVWVRAVGEAVTDRSLDRRHREAVRLGVLVAVLSPAPIKGLPRPEAGSRNNGIVVSGRNLMVAPTAHA